MKVHQHLQFIELVDLSVEILEHSTCLCIEALRKNVSSIRVATTKKPIPSVSCGQVQLVWAGE